MPITLEQKARYFAYTIGLGRLVDATRQARLRGDRELSTQVQGGRIRVVRTHYTKRKTTVTPLTDWLEIEAATEFINNL